MKQELLLWEKYRPTKFSNIILLPRIRTFLEKGIKTNLLFYGSPGLGKTSLARILTKEYNTLQLNTSLFTSIDVLRTTINDFVNTLNFQYDPNLIKIVFLDEFERVSSQFQNALKAYVEENHENVRFILSTNHIEKVEELGSRFNKVDFNPRNNEETEYLKNGYFKYLKAVVKAIGEEELINDDIIKKIIIKFFPDLRASVQMIDEIRISRDVNSFQTSNAGSYYIDFYNFILNGENDTVENYKYVMANYQDNPQSAFEILGRPFFTYIIETKKDLIIKKGAKIIEIQKNYNSTLTHTIDPIIHLLAYIYELKEVINGN
jgi:DNA polymerase III delta prime subunit